MLFSDVQSTQLLSAILPLPHLTVLRCAMCVCWCMQVSVCLSVSVSVCVLVSVSVSVRVGWWLCRLVSVCVGWRLCRLVSVCVSVRSSKRRRWSHRWPWQSIHHSLAFVRSSTFCGRHVSSLTTRFHLGCQWRPFAKLSVQLAWTPHLLV